MSKKLSTQFENNRQSILETTSRLFCDKGITATSFSDISKAVKLSKGTIYYYYPSKDHLIYEITEYHLNQVTNSIFAWLDTINEKTTTEDALMLLMQTIFDTIVKCRLHVCLINYSIMGNDAVNNVLKEKTAKWHTMVEVGLVKTGNTNAKKMTVAMFICLDSIILKRIMGTMDLKERDVCTHIAKNV